MPCCLREADRCILREIFVSVSAITVADKNSDIKRGTARAREDLEERRLDELKALYAEQNAFRGR